MVRLSARARILGWMLLLVAVALAASIGVTWRVLVEGVDQGVDRELAQEAAKLRVFARAGVDPHTGRPYATVERLLADYLQRNVPDRHETFFSLVGGRPYQRSAGTPPVRLDTDRAFVSRVAGADRPKYGWVDTPVGRARFAVLPVRVAGDHQQGALVAVEFRDLQARDVGEVVRVLTAVGFGALVLAGAGGWLVAGRVLAPVRLVRQTAEQISESDITRRIDVHGNDDVAALARTFNHMLDRLAEAFAAQRQFVDDAGHELRTPITVVRGHLELMGDDPSERRETLELVMDELGRMSRIVDDLAVLAKSGRPDFLDLGTVELADLPIDVAAKARALGDRRFEVTEVADARIHADGQRLTQALMQLVSNAVHHTGPGDVIRLGSAVRDDTVRVWVRDTGPGVPPEDRTRIFQRFTRGAGPRRSEGAGLGLAIVRVIAEAHGGRVLLDSVAGQGATFTLELPLRPEASTVEESVP